MVGVLKEFPVYKAIPPVAFAYQFTVPADAFTVNIPDPIPQIWFSEIFVIVGIWWTIASTETLTPFSQTPSDDANA